ncbi:MAG: hypothetical protein ACW99U_17920 [Candidatus Thorarchaeota archaeon]
MIFKSGITFAGVNLEGRIYSRDKGVIWFDDANLNWRTVELSVLNAGSKQSFESYDVVYSEQEIDNNEFLEWKWDAKTQTFMKLEGSTLTEISNFKVSAKQMWADRKAEIGVLQVDIVRADTWEELTKQHKKVLVGATWKDFTEADWEARDLGDENYVGDLNYSLSIWEKLKRLFS